jgi:hypothetical protein
VEIITTSTISSCLAGSHGAERRLPSIDPQADHRV